jgi:hypothetical protein
MERNDWPKLAITQECQTLALTNCNTFVQAWFLGQGIAIFSKHLEHTNIRTTVNVHRHHISEMAKSVATSINTAIGVYESE